MSERLEWYMDDDNKIKKTDPKQIFLKETSKYLQVKPEDVYNLEEEFDKTKKNKNILFKLVFLAFVSGILIITIAISTYLDNKYKNVEINIEDFEDLKLKEILDTARKSESELRSVQSDLDILKKERENAIQNIREQTRKRIDIINESTELKIAKNKKINEIKREETAGIIAVTRRYNERISEKEDEIKTIKQKISEYDKKEIDKAKKNEEVLGNLEHLHELEKQKIINTYENKIKGTINYYESQIMGLKSLQRRQLNALTLKYNPIFSNEENIKKIIDSSMKLGDETVDKTKFDEYYFPLLHDWDNKLSNEEIISREQFNDLRDKIVARSIIVNRLNGIPYTNSIPAALEHLDFYDRYIIDSYEYLWFTFMKKMDNKNATIQEKNKRIQQFEEAFYKTMTSGAENAYIIDAADKDDVFIVKSKLFKIKDGDVGTVFRGRNDSFGEKVATIIFTINEETGETKAKVTELKAGKLIQPLDKVKIRRSSGAEE